MNIKRQWIALYTLVRRELVRMFRIMTQVFIPPVITTTLYFLIFGKLIGIRIGLIQGVHYSAFIAPGLMMMAVIMNAYANVSSSLFSIRFQKSIEEILVSPMSHWLLLLGYVIGGILRGLIVGFLILGVSLFFVPDPVRQLGLTCFIMTLVAAIFSLAGFTNGMLARNFDDVMIIPTFVLTPLTYLGGVFYSIQMLPTFWQKISYFNPIFYMINALRYAMIQQQEVDIKLSLVVILSILIFLIGVNLLMLRKGIGLRD